MMSLCESAYHVQVEWRCLKDQLPTGSMTARLNRGLPLLTVKNEICDERLVIGRIFDDLEFKKLGGRSICKFHRVFIEHWPESIGADAEDNGRMTRVQVGELGKDENRIVCFETLHNPCLQPVPSVGLPGPACEKSYAGWLRLARENHLPIFRSANYAASAGNSEFSAELTAGWFTKTCRTLWHMLHSRRCSCSHSSNLSRPVAISTKRRFSMCAVTITTPLDQILIHVLLEGSQSCRPEAVSKSL